MTKNDPTAKAGAGPRPGRAARAGFMLIALVLIVMAYFPARRMPFFYDDRVTIVQNQMIQSRFISDVISENPFRALPNLTFALQLRLHANKTLPPGGYALAAVTPYIQRKFSGEQGRYLAFYNDPKTMESIPVSIDAGRGVFFPLPHAAPFHRFNLLLHFLNAALLYLVLKRLFPERDALAAIAGLAFLLHPLATEPVNYVTARFGLMAMSFSLAAVLFHLHADVSPRADIAALICFILALFCKETAAALPLLVFILDTARGRPRFAVLATLALSAVYAVLRVYSWPVIPEGSGGAALAAWRYILVEQRVIMLYLADIAIPIHLNFDPDVTPRMVPDLICTLLNTALLAAAALIIIKAALAGRGRSAEGPPPMPAKQIKARSKSKKPAAKTAAPAPPAASSPPWSWPAAVILMAWTAMAPASTLIPLSDLAKEERAYPLLIIVLPALVAAAGSAIFPRPRTEGTDERSVPPRSMTWACLAVILFGLTALTVERNREWKNELTLTRAMVEDSPNKARPLYQYATALKWSGRMADALFWYRQSLRLDPGNPDARTNIEVLRRELSSGGKGP